MQQLADFNDTPRTTWATGDYDAMMRREGLYEVGARLVRRVRVTRGSGGSGPMFAPRHEMVADEIARVLRPRGRLGLCAWTPEGAIGDFFRVLAAYLPPAPEFVDQPLAWGERRRCTRCSRAPGSRWSSTARPGTSPTTRLRRRSSATRSSSGPLVQARRLTEADGRWPRLRADLLELFSAHTTAGSPRVTFPGEYLVAVGRAPS